MKGGDKNRKTKLSETLNADKIGKHSTIRQNAELKT